MEGAAAAGAVALGDRHLETLPDNFHVRRSASASELVLYLDRYSTSLSIHLLTSLRTATVHCDMSESFADFTRRLTSQQLPIDSTAAGSQLSGVAATILFDSPFILEDDRRLSNYTCAGQRLDCISDELFYQSRTQYELDMLLFPEAPPSTTSKSVDKQVGIEVRASEGNDLYRFSLPLSFPLYVLK